MGDAEEIREAIHGALRVPDCGHPHISWPDADINTILNALYRAGFVVVRKDWFLAVRDVEQAQKDVRDQEEWVREHGATLDGYLERYGTTENPKDGTMGGAYIYAADIGYLIQLAQRLAKLEQEWKVGNMGGARTLALMREKEWYRRYDEE